MRFGQRPNSWPHHSSERLGEGVDDLVTKEPVRTGSFFLIYQMKVVGALRFRGGNESKSQSARFLVGHAIDYDFFQSKIRLRLRTNSNHLVEIFERNGFLRIIGSIRADKNSLANGIAIFLHNHFNIGTLRAASQFTIQRRGRTTNSALHGVAIETNIGGVENGFYKQA